MDKSLTSSTHQVEAANKRGIWVHYDAWAGGIWGVHWGGSYFCWGLEQDGGCLNVTKRPQIMIPSFDLRYSNVAMENPLFRRFFPMTSPFSSGIFQSATGTFRF